MEHLAITDPALATRLSFRLEWGLEPRRSYCWWYHFNVFAIVKGSKPKALLAYEGLEMIQFRSIPGEAFGLVGLGHNVSFPIDLGTGEYLTQWRNPVTGESFAQIPDNVIDDDPGRIFNSDGDIDIADRAAGVRPYQRTLHLEDGLLHKTETRNAPESWPGLFVESNTSYGRIDELLENEESPAMSTRGGGVWVNPFFKWMNMNHLEGHLVAFFRGRKIPSVDALPQRFFDRLSARHPRLLNVAPERFSALEKEFKIE